MEMLSQRFGCGRPEVACGARPPEGVIHHHTLDDRTHFARGKSQDNFAGMKVHSCISSLISQPLYGQEWGLERSLVPIPCHGHAPLQAASSSASRGNRAGVSVGLSREKGKGFSSLAALSGPCRDIWQVSGLCERAPFVQLQWNRATSSLIVWERSSISQPTVFL